MLTILINLDPKKQRLAALIVTIVAGMLIVAIVAGLFARLSENVRALDEQRETLGKLQAISAAGVSFRKEQLPTNKLDPKLLHGDNEAVITAALQSWIKDVAAVHGGEINSSSNIVEKSTDGFKMVGLKINLSGSMETVHQTISVIERNRPRLTIRQVVIHSNYQQLADRADIPVELTATVSFVGAMSASEPGGGAR